jgi:hypothetical protein
MVFVLNVAISDTGLKSLQACVVELVETRMAIVLDYCSREFPMLVRLFLGKFGPE